MTAFVDASVIVAILNGEDDALDQVSRLGAADAPLTSPIAVWEATVAVATRRREPPAAASTRVRELLTAINAKLVPIEEAEMQQAIEAYGRYGKGHHPARLNMGDCFAYACAKTNGAKLLYKGDDFSHTDLA
ncbi:type II toxin-antitoxin system VapC family toxin [Sphingomonas sp. RS2018]